MGARYVETRARPCENPADDPGKRHYGLVTQAVPLEEAERLLANDLAGWLSGEWRARWGGEKDLPEINLVFRCPFEFDDSLAGRRIPDAARELKVCFWYERDSDRINIDMDVWEEYVLMYGRDSTHKRNLRLILGLIESVYDAVNPYYGWADKEIDSSDESYECIAKGQLEPRNFCVVIGQPLIRRFDRNQFKGTPYSLRPLTDGGLMVISPGPDKEDIWKWEGDPKTGRWVRFKGRFGARLRLD